MSGKVNQIYSAAMQFCKNMNPCVPEIVIYGYAKLLSMDESLVRTFVSDDSAEDLEAAHRWFVDNHLDLNLIKTGMMMLLPLIPRDVVEKKEKEFREFLEKEGPEVGSDAILTKAKEIWFIPIMEVFAQGKELGDVFKCQAELKEKYPINEARTEETQQKRPASPFR